MNIRLFLGTIIVGLAVGCNASPPVGPPVNEVIQSASVVSFVELSEEEKADLENSYIGETFSFSSTGGWMSIDMKDMPIQDAYFIRTQINATALAYWTFLYSCGSPSAQRACSESELTQKMQSALSFSEPNRLYGKYRNSWQFFDGEDSLPLTRKFTGYGTVDLHRTRENETILDRVIVGPIPNRPTRVSIQLMNNIDGEGQVIQSPLLEISQQ